MTATAEPPVRPVVADGEAVFSRAEGIELLGPVHGCGYRDGAALVRRSDGQVVQLGALMYGLLECIDGERDASGLAAALSEKLGRRVGPEHVARLAQKLGRQGLLGGTEHLAPPRRNPLLALRFKVLVTNPRWTRALTVPFTFLFSPWLMWPIVAAFGAVFWFVLIHKGVASATAQAFHQPALLLLVFALAVISAGFHELGHAAACRYGGATPGGMGMGLYMVWPAFYTDVTDTYRLPKRDRLRVDLAGLYFNAVIAVLTLGLWLVWRSDALLLLVALQVLQMVKQLSPVIRADGYHILSDLTGVPDLYSHMGPTLRGLLPGHRSESMLTGRARVLVTVWVLIIVPVLISLSLGAILLLPRIGTSAWDSGQHIVAAIPHQAGHGQVIDLLASIVRLVALMLPVLGSVLVMQRVVRTTASRARAWSRGSQPREAVLAAAAVLIAAGLAWAWWPSGQYRPVRADQHGTIGSLVSLVTSPQDVARPGPAIPTVQLSPGTHLAEAMIPVGGASKLHPAIYVIAGGHGRPAVEIATSRSPVPGQPPASVTSPGGGSQIASGSSSTSTQAPNTSPPPASSATTVSPPSATGSSPVQQATAFPFMLPAAPGPHGTQALALNSTNGAVRYDVAYALITVKGGQPVTETNSAFAIAHCNACTTVAVSVQVVLIVGQTKDIAPINAAGALNYECPACTTLAIADQLVVTLKSQPSAALLAELNQDLKQLNALPELGASGTPTAVATAVAAIQQEIDTQLNNSGLPSTPIDSTSTTASTSTSTTATTSATTTAGTTATTPSAVTSAPTGTTTTTTGTLTTTSATTTQTTTSQASGTTTAPSANGTSTASGTG